MGLLPQCQNATIFDADQHAGISFAEVAGALELQLLAVMEGHPATGRSLTQSVVGVETRTPQFGNSLGTVGTSESKSGSRRGREVLSQDARMSRDDAQGSNDTYSPGRCFTATTGSVWVSAAFENELPDVRRHAGEIGSRFGETAKCSGRFRSDLFYRLGVFPIESPPLRDRREDIPAIALFFASRSAAAMGRSFSGIDRGTMNNLVANDWPGNVRELRNIIERAVILCSGKTLTVEESLGGAISRAPETPGSFKQDLHAVERTQIVQALKATNWKVKGTGGAADRLGLKPSTLRSRMQRLGISRP